MGQFDHYYTGADPCYIPAPKQRKFSLRELVQFITCGAIISLAITAGAMRLLWHSTGVTVSSTGLPELKHVVPEVYLAVAVPESEVTQGPRRARRSARASGDSTEVQQGEWQLIPLDPRTEKIILDSPLLRPPFPTENNIKPGTPRGRLVRSFGRPDLSVRTMQQERLIETYVYEQPDRATLVMMQDGRVVSAQAAQPKRARVLPSEPDADF